MGRLTVSAPKLSVSKSRLSGSSAVVQSPAMPWRAWYNTREWRDLRRRVLGRDHYTCNRCRRVCGGKFPADDSPVVDHIQPHRGDQARFWDEANLQVLCKSPCHDRVKQAEEQSSRHHIGVWD